MEAAADEGKAIRAEGKAAVRTRKEQVIGDAQEIDAVRYALLREQQELSPVESAELARAQVRIATGKLNDEPISGDDIELWQNGRLEQQVRTLEDACGAAELSQRDRDEDTDAVPMAARHYDGPRRSALQALFSGVGLDQHSGDGTVTAASVAAAYRALKGTDHAAVLEYVGICDFRVDVPAYPIRWLGQALKKCGLWLDASGGRLNRTYTLAAEAKVSRTGELLIPGFEIMRAVLDRRASAAPFADESIDSKRTKGSSAQMVDDTEVDNYHDLPSLDEAVLDEAA
jgi:hypothetical protein